MNDSNKKSTTSSISYKLLLFIFIILSSVGCEDIKPEDEIITEPMELSITKNLDYFITEPDTLRFDIQNDEYVDSIKITLKAYGSSNKEYALNIPNDQRMFVLNPEDYRTAEYDAVLSVKSTDGTIVNTTFYFDLSNPNEDMLILPSFDNYFVNNLWVYIEDTTGQMIHFQQVPVVSGRTYIKRPATEVAQTSIFNVHLLFDDTSIRNRNEIITYDLVVRSLYKFSGRDMSSTLFPHVPGFIYGKGYFKFINVPDYTSFYLYRPYMLYDTNPFELNDPFECYPTSHHPGLYLVLNNHEKSSYLYEPDLRNYDNSIDLGLCKPVKKSHTIQLPDATNKVKVTSWLEKWRFGPEVQLHHSTGDHVQSITFARPEEFDEIDFYETSIVVPQTTGVQYSIMKVGDIPTEVTIPPVYYTIKNHFTRTDIFVDDNYDYFTGYKLIIGNRKQLAWLYVTPDTQVQLPNFPEVVTNQLPVIKEAIGGEYQNITTVVDLNQYSEFKNYHELMLSFDLFNMCPFTLKKHQIESFTRVLNFEEGIYFD